VVDTSLLNFRRVGTHNKVLETSQQVGPAIAVLLKENDFVLGRREDAFGRPEAASVDVFSGSDFETRTTGFLNVDPHVQKQKKTQVLSQL
jgi:hypothetical protein